MNRKSLILVACFIFFIPCVKAQFYSASSNIPGLLTTNINMELSMTLNRKFSLHALIQYNPFTFSENRRFQNLTFMPGVRYWFSESYSKSFIGIHALGSRYHIGNIWNKLRYDGWAVGAGLSLGKAYPLSTKWNIEWEVAASLLWTDFDKYRCARCGTPLGSKQSIYLVPTRAAINLVYLF